MPAKPDAGACHRRVGKAVQVTTFLPAPPITNRPVLASLARSDVEFQRPTDDEPGRPIGDCPSRAAAGPKCGRLVLRQLSSAAAAHTHTAWHARRPSPPTSDPGGTAPRARCRRRAGLQPPAGDAGQSAHAALTVARAVESASDASPTEVEPRTVRVCRSWTRAETIPVRSIACDGASTRVPRSASGAYRGRAPSPSPISSALAWCPHHLVDRTGSRLRGARLLAHRDPDRRRPDDPLPSHTPRPRAAPHQTVRLTTPPASDLVVDRPFGKRRDASVASRGSPIAPDWLAWMAFEGHNGTWRGSSPSVGSSSSGRLEEVSCNSGSIAPVASRSTAS